MKKQDFITLEKVFYTVVASIAGLIYLTTSARADVLIGGYLPEKPNSKVCVKVTGNTITSITESSSGCAAANSQDLVLNTEDMIFPGMMDMHSHIKYNVLPLWDLALGQFKNRFEWRKNFPKYKDAVSSSNGGMKGIKGEAVCGAVRYAEIKALLGGATAIQGIGNDGACGAGFGIRNLEVAGEFGIPNAARGMTDMVMPDMVGSIYAPFIEPKIKNGMSYDDALKATLVEFKIDKWRTQFMTTPPSLVNGLKLLLDLNRDFAKDYKLNPNEDIKQAGATFKSAVEPLLRKDLETVFKLSPKKNAKGISAVDKQIESMMKFLFGGATDDSDEEDGEESEVAQAPASGGYLTVGEKYKESVAWMQFVGKGGILSVDGKIRRYLNMFEKGVRQSLQRTYNEQDKNKKNLAVVAHLSEGMQTDPYNQSEYRNAVNMGLVGPELVMIHAVGLTDADFDDAKRRNLSIVWSPMSNLLLYGETLDVGAVKRKGINMALGVDWTPTGSRNILDEIKIAKRWILSQKVKEFSPQTLNKDLVEMATLNAAKALRIAGRWGKIAPNYAADILLVKKPSSMNSPDAAYAALVDANQKDLNLVMVDGNPVYGEASYIQAASSKLGGPTPEIVIDGNNAASACKGMQKAVRLAKSKNETLESKLEKGGLQSTSVSKLKAFLTPRVAMLDPLFTCEHDDILRKMGKNPQGSFTYVDRFPVFIENEVPRNKSNRVSERVKYPTLKEDFTPLAKPAVLK